MRPKDSERGRKTGQARVCRRKTLEPILIFDNFPQTVKVRVNLTLFTLLNPCVSAQEGKRTIIPCFYRNKHRNALVRFTVKRKITHRC